MLLAHELVSAEGHAMPDRWMLFLHGILGRRANWRSLARRWVQARPSWGAVLVDLRDHGESQGLPGPRTVAAAGADLVALAEALGESRTARVAGVLGHSFGGKVAIAAAGQLRAAGQALDELWVIDAPPGPRTQPRDRTTERTFALLERLPARFESRSEFIDAIVAGGLARPIGQWLATNLVEVEGGWRFGLELPRVRELLRDFCEVDLWPVVEQEAAAGTRVVLVLGGRSEAVFGEELERAQELAGTGRIELEVIEGAGHWVHVDRPNELLAILQKNR